MTMTPGRAAPGPSSSSAGPERVAVADVKRELLVRHLRAWASAALDRARRGGYAHGYADLDDGRAAEAAMRVLAEQTGPARGRELVMVAVADDPAGPARRLAAVQAGLPPSVALVVHTVPGGTDARLPVALRAAGVTRAPLLGFLDAGGAAAPPAMATVAALAAGRPAEVLLVLAPAVLSGLAAPDTGPGSAGDPGPDGDSGSDGGLGGGDRFFGDGRWRTVSAVPPEDRRAFLVEAYRTALRDAGFPLVSVVEFASDPAAHLAPDPAFEGEVVVFATGSGKSLEGYKEALWTACAGMRLRDPGHPTGHPVDTSARPDLAQLRERLADRLRGSGRCTVTELRTFTLTETVYRAADATRVLQDLLDAGSVTRTPAAGRLGGDVVVALAEPA